MMELRGRREANWKNKFDIPITVGISKLERELIMHQAFLRRSCPFFHRYTQDLHN
jgi:hypothetical protein